MAFAAAIPLAPEGNLSRYLQEIRKFPMLAPEEELSLAKRWRDNQDERSAHKLVTSHLRLVAKIAMGYRGYGLPVGELISEGNVGMMQAVKRFDPDRFPGLRQKIRGLDADMFDNPVAPRFFYGRFSLIFHLTHSSSSETLSPTRFASIISTTRLNSRRSVS